MGSISVVHSTLQIRLVEEYSPKQQEESIHFYDHPNHGPPQQHNKHASSKKSCSLSFVPLEEKSKCPLQTYDECQTTDEENLKSRS